MKKLTTTILACGLLASGLHRAVAAPVMRLSADGGVTWTNIVDNGPADSQPAVGFISYQGTLGNWIVTVASGIGEPLRGSSITPVMDVGTLDLSDQPSALIVQMSDTGFTPFPNETFVASLLSTTTGTITFNSYRDSGNVLFGTLSSYSGDPSGISPSPTASGLITEGPFTLGTFQVSNSVVVANGGIAPYSLTLETIIIHTAGGQTSSDATLYALPPPPCNCTLTFPSASITNCSDDTLPDVVATEDCGFGPTPVTVTFVGAVTNGTNPRIITRTYTAPKGCGGTQTFVQTVTTYLTPDCTITPSTLKPVVGGSNYTASVADAGPGATYDWHILNGFITATSNNTITWAADTNTAVPVTIIVTVKTAAGCQKTCSVDMPLIPKPPEFACTIPGVILSDTSWNKFNIPSGASPQVWVHLHLNKLTGIPTSSVSTVQFVGVTLTLNGASYSLPDGVLTFDPAAPATITTTFTGGKWQTLINPNNLSDEMFFTGVAIPVTPAIAAGAKATLTYNTLSSVAGIAFTWQWSAAVYTYWPADWNQALIQPFHGNGLHAGTPLNIKVQKSLIAGPRGGGGSNFTGSWSATGSAQCQ